MASELLPQKKQHEQAPVEFYVHKVSDRMLQKKNLTAYKWTKEHDVLLAREKLTAEPYNCKNRSQAALEEIVGKEKTAQSELDIEESVKRDELQDKASAKEMRLQAMEKLGESKKRREASGLTAGDQKKKKAKRSGSDTLDFMREKWRETCK
ncbi:hypothetical protein P5673_030243 [Acropora cervicornis]|uniref:Uncharacterized protein n=1 Tax=Acropora cervicornis TaxID=6130 RepID=A0AAD9PUE5_ACRCE|nr:hypothetical protein P5673_030243 [Acropora cervicornis]